MRPAFFLLFNPDAVILNDVVLFITDQGEGEIVFGDKIGVTIWRVDTDSKEGRSRIEKRLVPVAQSTCLRGAARRIVLRIKVEHNRFPSKIGEIDGLAFLVWPSNGGGGEVRGSVPGS